MKLIPYTLIAVFMTVSAATASAVPGWMTDMSVALQRAQTQDKDLVLNFMGSDWCQPCIVLQQQVFGREAFVEQVSDDFVLVTLDFPRHTPQKRMLIAQNAHWKDRLGVIGFPTVILADATGTPYAKTGYIPGGVDVYAEHLDELRQRRVDRDEMLQLARTSTGVERAKYLDAAMESVGLDMAAMYYTNTIKQIAELDAENQAGLRAKYAPIVSMFQIDTEMEAVIGLLQQNRADEAVARVDQIINEYQPQGMTVVQMRMMQAKVRMAQRQAGEATRFIDLAIAAAPDPQVAMQLEQVKQQMSFAPMPRN